MNRIDHVVGEFSGAAFVFDPEAVGSGVEAVVYLARRNNSHRPGDRFAVKVFKDADPTRWVEKCRALIEKLKALHSIARLVEIGLDPDTGNPVALVLEFYEAKRSLRDLFESGGTSDLTFTQKVLLCKAIVSAFRQFTEQGRLVKGDGAPQNILMRDDLEAVTFIDNDSDWLFRYRRIDGSITDYVGSKGTPGYRAPELVSDETLVPCAATTLWTLAVILFEVIYGQHPAAVKVTAATQGLELEDLIGNGFYPVFFTPHPDYPRPAYDATHAEFPDDIIALFRTALLGPKEHRPTAAMWAEQFEKIVIDEPVPEVEPVVVEPPARKRRRWPWMATTTAAAVMLRLVGGGGGEGQTSNLQPAKQQQQTPKTTNEKPFFAPSIYKVFGHGQEKKDQ